MAVNLLVSKCCSSVCKGVRLQKSLLELFIAGRTAAPHRLCLSRGVLTSTEAVIVSKKWQERHEKEQLDFNEIVRGLEEKLGTTRLAKAAEMNKLFDCVETTEQLDVAVGLLVKFAASPNPVRVSFGLILARACIRLKVPQRARHVFEQKSRFRVYPTRHVYHTLMDVFLMRRNYKDVLTTYNLMLSDGLEPNWVSHHLAFLAHLRRGAEGDLDQALELQEEVVKRKPDRKRESQQLVIKYCLKHGWVEKALGYVEEFEREYGVDCEDAFTLRLRCLTVAGQLSEAVELLKKPTVSNAAVLPSTKATILLIQSVLFSDNEALKQSLQETVEALSSHPKFQPEIMKALNDIAAAAERASSSDIAMAGAEEEGKETPEGEEGEEKGEEEAERKEGETSQPSSEVERLDDTTH